MEEQEFNLSEKERRKKISETMKKKGGNAGTWKKGQKAWNYEHGKTLKRKMKKFNGKLVLKSHYIMCKNLGIKNIPRGFVVHHQDHNSLNDEIDNLVLMTDKAHRKLHINISKIKAAEELSK